MKIILPLNQGDTIRLKSDGGQIDFDLIGYIVENYCRLLRFSCFGNI